MIGRFPSIWISWYFTGKTTQPSRNSKGEQKKAKTKQEKYPKSKSEFRLIVHVEVTCVRSFIERRLWFIIIIIAIKFIFPILKYSLDDYFFFLKSFFALFLFFCKRFQLFTVFRSFCRKQSATRRPDYLWCHSNRKLFGGNKTEITDGPIEKEKWERGRGRDEGRNDDREVNRIREKEKSRFIWKEHRLPFHMQSTIYVIYLSHKCVCVIQKCESGTSEMIGNGRWTPAPYKLNIRHSNFVSEIRCFILLHLHQR